MCTIVKSAIRRVLPQATLVVEHFHLVQLANQTLTEVRRRVTSAHRGRAVQPALGDRRADHRRVERQGRPPGPAWQGPDPPGPGTGPRSAVPVLPPIRRCADLLELQRRATTVETWWPEILAFLHTGITNAGSEGTYRIARGTYSFRDPGNQRLRTRCATTHRARGHLDAR
ncbi:transposase [Streptomyces cucumeris]|uniref:transposase n=1 Tax=Streptomyces cucumeris TaxID=2962890 RepID=UPI003D703357